MPTVKIANLCPVPGTGTAPKAVKPHHHPPLLPPPQLQATSYRPPGEKVARPTLAQTRARTKSRSVLSTCDTRLQIRV